MVKTDNFILRYSNCWEDADLLVSQLSAAKGGKFCSIASGGENSLSLLTLDPELLVIVDVNPLQIYLTELKILAIKEFDYEECLQFLGYKYTEDRKTKFLKIKKDLSADAKSFWEKNISKIENGIIHAGHSEGNIRFFANYIRPLFHSRSNVIKLMQPKSADEQKLFYNQVWDNSRWKMIFKLFFSRAVMKIMAPDPDFLNFYNGNIAEYLYNKTATQMSSVSCQKNHILNYILLGEFGEILPHYMKEENFLMIKNKLGSIKFYHGFAEEPSNIYGKFNAFNLSNIFEYTLPNEFDQIAKKLSNGGTNDALYMYWNILIPRKLSSNENGGYVNLLDSSISPVEDKGWLYSSCLVDKKH